MATAKRSQNEVEHFNEKITQYCSSVQRSSHSQLSVAIRDSL